MNKKLGIGIVAIIAIVAIAMFAGCIEEEEAPISTPIPTPEIAESPTPTSTPTPIPTPKPEPKFSRGDVVQEKYPTYPDVAHLILDYTPDEDKYKTTLIHKVNGVWLYRSEDEHWWSRAIIEGDEIKVGHVDVSRVMSGDEYWEGGGYERAHGYEETPTPSKSGRWHTVTSFSGSDDKTTRWFTIKGDEWRIKFTVKPEAGYTKYSIFSAFVYPRGETAHYVSSFDCDGTYCSDANYIYKGNGDYYIEVISNRNSWKLEVEDYY